MIKFKKEQIIITEANKLVLVKFKTLSAYDNVISHAFTTRIGGFSEGYLASANFGKNSGDNIENIKENTALLATAIGINPTSILRTRQLHSDVVLCLDDYSVKDYLDFINHNPVDGLLTSISSWAILGIFADCVPVFLFDPIRKNVGLIHSGWRGTVHKIVPNAIRLMEKKGSKLKDIIAVIGPAISKCCFETGKEVVEQLEFAYGNIQVFYTKNNQGKYMLDLKNIIAKSLADLGLLYDNISVSDLCTSCRQDLFYSHRSSKGKTGRMAGIIKLIGE